MAMSVEKLTVCSPIVPTQATWPNVVGFNQLIQRAEDQSTASASSVLPFEQVCLAPGQFRMAAQPSCPIDRVAIERARYSSDRPVPADRRLRVERKRYPIFRAEDPVAWSA